MMILLSVSKNKESYRDIKKFNKQWYKQKHTATKEDIASDINHKIYKKKQDNSLYQLFFRFSADFSTHIFLNYVL
jgi:hypothetical protein